jgi:hypothetical protein
MTTKARPIINVNRETSKSSVIFPQKHLALSPEWNLSFLGNIGTHALNWIQPLATWGWPWYSPLVHSLQPHLCALGSRNLRNFQPCLSLLVLLFQLKMPCLPICYLPADIVLLLPEVRSEAHPNFSVLSSSLLCLVFCLLCLYEAYISLFLLLQMVIYLLVSLTKLQTLWGCGSEIFNFISSLHSFTHSCSKMAVEWINSSESSFKVFVCRKVFNLISSLTYLFSQYLQLILRIFF